MADSEAPEDLPWDTVTRAVDYAEFTYRLAVEQADMRLQRDGDRAEWNRAIEAASVAYCRVVDAIVAEYRKPVDNATETT